MKKYELTNNKINYWGIPLYQIRALRDIASKDVKAGDLGGYIESEKNLSHENSCWVHDNAWVCGNAKVFDNAVVSNDAWVFGNAEVYDDAWVFGNAEVYGKAKVYGNAWVYDKADICGRSKVGGDTKIYGEIE